jgi:hypothetical protein
MKVNWNIKRNVVVTLCAVAFAGMFPAASQAVINEVDLSSGSETNFDANISTIDLIQAGSPTLAGPVVASVPGTFSETGSNNGDAVHNSGLSFWGGQHPGGVDLTYTLAGSPTGYDITSINSIYGWQDSRYRHAAQEWTVLATTLDNPVYSLASVVFAPFAAGDGAAGSTQVNLTDSSGLLATGVTALRFHLDTYASAGQPGYTGEIGVVREFDVFGAPTSGVPEPATATLSLLAFGGLMCRRRRGA